jgi:multicomponent K+:H+ antiporter subunit F
MMLSLARMIAGPRAEDRVLAFDCLYVNTMLVVLSLGLIYRSNSYFEAALLIALFGFVGSTAMSKFLLRGEIIE